MDKTSNTDQTRQVTALRSASLDGQAAPSRVLLTRWGVVESTNGSFVVDEESIDLAVAAFKEHGTDLPIDYEHQTLGGTFSSPSGQAPAAAWIKNLSGEAGVGLVADIEWTPQAEEMVTSKAYRYLSPVAVIRKTDRKLLSIHSAALTNKPAIVGMQPLVNVESLDAEADPQLPLTRLCEELDLHHETSPDEVLLAASRRIEHLEREACERHATHRIREAMQAGKLVEAQRAWAEALVAREEGLFDDWLRTAPVIVQPGRTNPPGHASDAQRRVAGSATRARAEYRAEPMLRALTTEAAYVADATRLAAC